MIVAFLIIIAVLLLLVIFTLEGMLKARRTRIEIKDVNPRIRPHSRWRHFKGNVYTILAVGHHSETLEPMVIYTHESGEVWVRPVSMWFEMVDGKMRFEPEAP